MRRGTIISWTQQTWNPTTGCSRVSDGCKFCYAERLSLKYKTSKKPWTKVNAKENVVLHEDRLKKPFTWKDPVRVFVNSMSDLFHEEIPDEFIAKVWQIMAVTPQHTYQILTKRPERAVDWVERWYKEEIEEPLSTREIPGCTGYLINTHGAVFSKRFPERALQQQMEHGYMRVDLSQDGVERHKYVHSLMLHTFVGPPKADQEARHRNGNRADNHLSNLCWGTQEQNRQDRTKHGRGRPNVKLTADDVEAIRRETRSVPTVAEHYGISITQVRNIIKGRQWQDLGEPDNTSRPILDNVWLGVSVEDCRVIGRIETLRQCKAQTKFISYEPALGPLGKVNLSGYSWLIVGGESGPGYRKMDMAWAREAWGLSKDYGLAFFFKQDHGFVTELRPWLVDEAGKRWHIQQYPGEMTKPEEITDRTLKSRGADYLRKHSIKTFQPNLLEP